MAQLLFAQPLTPQAMTINKGIIELRKFLDELAEKKTDADRLLVLFKMRACIELIEDPLKERADKQKAAYAAKTRIIKKALRQFFSALDRIYDKYQELGDTDVKEQMYRAIYRGFIQPQRGYVLPEKFGMFSDKGNDLVKAALHGFLTHPQVVAAAHALKTPKDRFAAFQDGDAQTAAGTNYVSYFGYSKQVRVA
ncbi:MAG TPA: hypothetical protein VL527_17995 [Dongiaceae bacterium]|jgi:hypothetical protein|nr:hypothetical protein [Dongiaceae bacterium]